MELMHQPDPPRKKPGLTARAEAQRAERQAREAAALRENLRKRKAREAALKAEKTPPETAPD